MAAPTPNLQPNRNRSNEAQRALSPQLAGLLRESWWLLFVAAAVFLVLILLSYDKADPGWSQSLPEPAPVRNSGGEFGAWLADLLLSVFGISTWWWVGFCLMAIWWGYKRIDQVQLSGHPIVVSLLGYALLLLASTGLESLRLYHLAIPLPYQPGGMLGKEMARFTSHVFGFSGGTLVMLAAMGLGFSLFTGMSWIKLFERVGTGCEWLFFKVVDAGQAWQDRRIGKKKLAERTEFVAEVKSRDVEKPPVRIEPPVVEIPRSERMDKEKQAPLFADLPDSPLPPLHLLEPAAEVQETVSTETLEFTSRLIERKLADFGVTAHVIAAYPGPVITRYEIDLAAGIKGSQVVNLANDLARALSVSRIRVVETIPGKTYMGLELPNPKRQVVRLSEILASQVYNDMHSPLTIALGKDIAGKAVVADLAKAPHMLVAGTTGSGKSVMMNAMILSLVYKATPQDVRLILVDPKMLEMSVYADIPHLLAPVVTDMKHAAYALNWCVAEMERRYKLMSALGVRNLAGYNQKIAEAAKAGTRLTNPFSITPDEPEPLEHMPYIVVIIDELADLMMVVGKKIEELIARLAQKARAAGIHLVLATQRPSVDVITGLIKANIPTRLAFQVSSKIDSRTILDQMGAEALLGQGDGLFLPPGSGAPMRVHGAFVSDDEVHHVVDHLKAHGEPNYIDGILSGEATAGGDGDGGDGPALDGGGEADPVYDQAVAYVLQSRRASISAVQRQLRIGYNRAARLIEQMEAAGIVSPMETNGNRTVLVPPREG